MPAFLTVALAHPVPDPQPAPLSATECELRASEGVHHGCVDHHEEVGSELWPGYALNGIRSECLELDEPLSLYLTPPVGLSVTPEFGGTSKGGLLQLRLPKHGPTHAPQGTSSSS